MSKVVNLGSVGQEKSCSQCGFWDQRGMAGALPDADSVFSSWCRSCKFVLDLGWGAEVRQKLPTVLAVPVVVTICLCVCVLL